MKKRCLALFMALTVFAGQISGSALTTFAEETGVQTEIAVGEAMPEASAEADLAETQAAPAEETAEPQEQTAAPAEPTPAEAEDMQAPEEEQAAAEAEEMGDGEEILSDEELLDGVEAEAPAAGLDALNLEESPISIEAVSIADDPVLVNEAGEISLAGLRSEEDNYTWIYTESDTFTVWIDPESCPELDADTIKKVIWKLCADLDGDKEIVLAEVADAGGTELPWELTLTSEEFAAKVGAAGISMEYAVMNGFGLQAEVYAAGSEEPAAWGGCGFGVWEPSEEFWGYDYMGSRYLLGDRIEIEREAGDYCINNAQHWNTTYHAEVTEVSLEWNDEEAISEKAVPLDDDRDGWYFEALQPGTATIHLTLNLTPYDSEEDVIEGVEYSWKVYVQEYRYNLDLTPDGGVYSVFPGNELHLSGCLSKEYKDENGDWHEEPIEDPQAVEWTLRNDEWADGNVRISPDTGAIGVTVSADPDIQMEEDMDVELVGSLKEDPKVMYNCWITIEADGYYTVKLPADEQKALENLVLYREIEVHPELWYYTGSDDEGENRTSQIADGDEFFWEYDGNALEIEQVEGDAAAFTIKRRGDWKTGMTLGLMEAEGKEENFDARPFNITLEAQQSYFVDISPSFDDQAYVYTDDKGEQTFAVTVDPEIPEGAVLEWQIGRWDEDGFMELPELEEKCEQSEDNQSITFRGSDWKGVELDGPVGIRAVLYSFPWNEEEHPDEEAPVLGDGGTNLEIREATEQYRFDDAVQTWIRDYDNQESYLTDGTGSGYIECLPGEEFEIGNEMGFYLENSAHPWLAQEETGGLDGVAAITDVSLGEIKDGAAKAVTLRGDQENGWTVRTYSACQTELILSFERWDKTQGTRRFPLNVTNTSYDVWVDTVDRYLTPGDQVGLTANVAIHTPDGDVEPENVSFLWKIREPEFEDIFTISGEQEQTCTVTASEEQTGGAWIGVTVSIDGNKVGYWEDYFSVNNYKIIDKNENPLDIYLLGGETVSFQPVLYEGEDQVEDVRYRWEPDGWIEEPDSDEDGFAVMSENGELSITLPGPDPDNPADGGSDGAYLTLIAEVKDEEGGYYEATRCNWNLNRLWGNIDFKGQRGEGGTWIYDNEEKHVISIVPEEGLVDPERQRGTLQIDVVTGSWNPDGDFEVSGEAGSDCYEAAPENLTICLYGPALYQWRSQLLKEMQVEDPEEGPDYAVRVQLMSDAEGQEEAEALATGYLSLDIREHYSAFDEEEVNDAQVVFGDELWYRETTLHIEDAEHPYGDEIPYTITKVEIYDETGENETDLAEVKQSDDGRWIVTIGEQDGIVTLEFTATPKNPKDGEEEIYQAKLQIVGELEDYRIETTRDTGTELLLPGQTQSIKVIVRHIVGTSDEGNGPSYENTVVDPKMYTLTFENETPDTLDVTRDGYVTATGDVGEEGRVHVHVEFNDEEWDPLDSYEFFYVQDCYYAIEAESYYNAPIGGTITVEPKLVHYDSDLDKPEEMAGANFEVWDRNEENGCEFTPSGDGGYTAVNPQGQEVYSSQFGICATLEEDEYGLPVEEEFYGWFSFCNHENLSEEMEVTLQPDCITTGSQGKRCQDCGFVTEEEEIPALGHTNEAEWKVTKEATCVEDGEKTGPDCERCGRTNEVIPATGEHTPGEWETTKEATCTATGEQEQKCTVCGESLETKEIPMKDHSYGEWKTVSPATTEAPEKQQRSCTVCGTVIEERTVGEKLQPSTETPGTGSGTGTAQEPFIRLNVKSLPLKVKQSTKAVKVEMAAGDSIVSWTSSNKKVATVNASGKIKGKKKGRATITVTLASGKTASVKIKVQTPKVTTKKIKGVAKKLTLTKGQKLKLTPELYPLTSVDKITYTSSNKKVATVDKKGNIKAKKSGTAKITVKSGKKKVVCKVTVK